LADDEQDESEVVLDVGWGAAWAKLKVVLCRSGDILRVRTVWLREGCEPFDWTCEPNSTALRPPFRTAHYFGLYGRARPAKTPGCIAVSARLLIRMRSQVQVQAGPPHIPAGHSAVGSEPGAAAASVGRAGAARLSPSARPSALSGRLPGRQAPRRPRTVVAHPALVDSYAAGAATSCRQPAPVPSRRQPPALRTPAWPAWSLCGYARPPAPNPALNARPRQRRPQACSAVDRAARRRGAHRDLDPTLW
jgi:hypothetical protein